MRRRDDLIDTVISMVRDHMRGECCEPERLADMLGLLTLRELERVWAAVKGECTLPFSGGRGSSKPARPHKALLKLIGCPGPLKRKGGRG